MAPVDTATALNSLCSENAVRFVGRSLHYHVQNCSAMLSLRCLLVVVMLTTLL